MRMKSSSFFKKKIATILAVIMFFTTFITMGNTEKVMAGGTLNEGGFSYTIDTSGAVITGFTNPNDVTTFNNGNVIIPDTLGGNKVYSIEANALSAPGVNSITFKTTGLLSIGDSAFNNDNISTLNIPASVTTIGPNIASYCFKFTTFTVDSLNANYSAENGVLYDKGKTTLVTWPFALGSTESCGFSIPPTVTTIGSNAFADTEISSLTVSSNITRISSNAFQYADILNSIYWNANSNATIASGAFENIQQNVTVYGVSGTSMETYISNNKANDCANVTYSTNIPTSSGDFKYTVAGGVATIVGVTQNFPKDFASGVVTIPSIMDGYSVDAIGESAFSANQIIKNLTVGGIPNINNYAFYGCTNLEKVTVLSGVTTFGDFVFQNCSNLTTVGLPEGLTKIGIGDFYACSSLTTVYLPQSLTVINIYDFALCTSLVTLNFPEGLTEIGDGSFYGCTSLEYINIPSGVTAIGSHEFEKCSALRSVFLNYNNPSLPSSIGASTFASDTDVTIYGKGNDAFFDQMNTIGNNFGGTNILYSVYQLGGTTITEVSPTTEQAIVVSNNLPKTMAVTIKGTNFATSSCALVLESDPTATFISPDSRNDSDAANCTDVFNIPTPKIDGTYFYDVYLPTANGKIFTGTRSIFNVFHLPRIDIITPTASSASGAQKITVNGQYFANGNLQLKDGSGTVYVATSLTGTIATFDVTVPSADGTYTYTAYGTDSLGNFVSSGFSSVFTIKNVVSPRIDSITPTASSASGAQTITVNGQYFVNGNLQLKDGSGTVYVATSLTGTMATFDVTVPSADGTYTYTAYGMDSSGNFVSSGVSSVFTIKNVVPVQLSDLVLSTTSIPVGGGSFNVTVKGVGLTTQNTSIAVSPNNFVSVGNGVLQPNGDIVFVVTLPANTGKTDMTYNVSANVGSSSLTKVVMVVSSAFTPTVSNISATPTSLSNNGGNVAITVTGKNLTNNITLLCGNTSYSPTSVSSDGKTAYFNILLQGNNSSVSVTYVFKGILYGTVDTGLSASVVVAATQSSGGGSGSSKMSSGKNISETPPAITPLPTTTPTEKSVISAPVYGDDGKVTGYINLRTDIPYISGYSDGTFKANKNVTRAELASILYTLVSNDDKNGAKSNNFKDMDSNAWYFNSVAYLSSKGILNGYGDGTFKPNQPLTRGEFATILARFAGTLSPVKTLSDVDKNSWSYDGISKVISKGWMSGYPDGTFRSNRTITRAEMVVAMNNMLNKSNVGSKSENGFSDVNSDFWANGAINSASTGN